MGGVVLHWCQALPTLSLGMLPLPTVAHLNTRTKAFLPEHSPAGPSYCASKRGRKEKSKQRGWP